jgi:proline racemase
MTTLNWNARSSPEGARVITTLDTHTAGEPLRIVTGGYPNLRGATILERRRYALEHHDDLRASKRAATPCMAALSPPPVSGEQTSACFSCTTRAAARCGHGVIALVTALGDRRVSGERRSTRWPGYARWAGARGGACRQQVERVSFRNVPSFVYAPNLK